MSWLKAIATKIRRFFAVKNEAPPDVYIPLPKIPQDPPVVKPRINFSLLETSLRRNLSSLYHSHQLEGYQRIIAEFQMTHFTDIRWLAYILATALHETAHTMKPVTEYGSQAYLRSKKYWPYIGRGYVQLTHKYNYEKYGIADNMEKALDADFAAFIIIDGMTKGIFTRKKLGDYFNDRKDDAYNARRIVNGIDKSNPIAGYHAKILKALIESKVTIENQLPLS